MTRTLELVFAGLPVRRATKMGATRVDHKKAIRSLSYPDSILLLPLGVDSKCVIGGCAYAKYVGWFQDRARQKEPQEHEKGCD